MSETDNQTNDSNEEPKLHFDVGRASNVIWAHADKAIRSMMQDIMALYSDQQDSRRLIVCLLASKHLHGAAALLATEAIRYEDLTVEKANETLTVAASNWKEFLRPVVEGAVKDFGDNEATAGLRKFAELLAQ